MRDVPKQFLLLYIGGSGIGRSQTFGLKTERYGAAIAHDVYELGVR